MLTGVFVPLALLVPAAVCAAVPVQPFTYPSYADVVSRLLALNATYPRWVDVWTAQVCAWLGLRAPWLLWRFADTLTPSLPTHLPPHMLYVHVQMCTHEQQRYGVGSPVERCGQAACEQWFIRITDEASPRLAQLPQVFFSGNLHGDEQVGDGTTQLCT